MSTQNAIETEVKLAAPEWSPAMALERLTELGLRVSAERVFEANYVYDTRDRAVRGAQMLLRLRRVGERTILTWKGPSKPGRHKSRPELETGLESFEVMHAILENLGYGTTFRYEKYRTEFSNAEDGTATFDETPIGNFIELEGTEEWIDETAAKLGFGIKDYLLESYGRLYLADCERQGLTPGNMLFAPPGAEKMPLP